MIVAELTDGENPVKIPSNPDLPSSKMHHNERIIGHALYYYAYSSWEGKILFVEDLFVREEYRSTFHMYTKGLTRRTISAIINFTKCESGIYTPFLLEVQHVINC